MPTYSFDELGLDSEWWPASLGWHSAEEPVVGDRIKLALIENYDEPLKHRHVYAALGEPEEALRLVTTLGFKGHDPDSNGPHPSAAVGGYEPSFWVFTDGTVRFEPLGLRWAAGGMEVVVPDQGLLMTYGLVPRYTRDQVAHWDDLEEPTHDWIVADGSTSNLFGEPGRAFVDAGAALIQDYSSLRGLAVVQVFYVENAQLPDEQLLALVGDEHQVDIELPGRTISLKRVRDGRILAQCWGIRSVIDPGAMPLTEGRWDYEELEWPGAGVVSKEDARMAGIADRAEEVFVRDTVLGRFEGQPDMDISPELGAVSYKNQRGVGWCQRYGRDLIRVDLKKLYEGNRPAIVRHYHERAVEPPPFNHGGWDEPNVASRAGRIAYAWADLGACLKNLAVSLALPATVEDLVAVSRGDLEHRGWWSDQEFEVIARHIPPALNRDRFIDRCGAIYQSTVDRIGERHLRSIVHQIGFDPEQTRDYRSLKLLELIAKAATAATEAGLDIVADKHEVVQRALEGVEAPDISMLFKLNNLRQLDSHAVANIDARLEEILRDIGIDPEATVGGFDEALDAIYDLSAQSIDSIAGIVCGALSI